MSIYDVKVKVDLAKPIGKVGFGVPLILEESAQKAVAYTEVSSLAEVVTAGFAAETAVYKAANAIFMQDNAPAKIAVCAATEKATAWLGVEENVSKGWRQLVLATTEGAKADVDAIAAVVEALEGKAFFPNVSDTTAALTKYDRTFPVTAESGEYGAASVVGATAGLTIGSFTYKNIKVKGVAPLYKTATELEAIHTNGINAIVEKAGDIVLSEGKATSGEYMDILDIKDFVVNNVTYKVQKLFNDNLKVPYDDIGIEMIASVVRSVLKDCYSMGMIATNEDGTPAYTLNFKKRAETSESDRAERAYNGGSFTFTAAGAVHTADITCTIEF